MGVVQVLVRRELCQKRGEFALGKAGDGMIVLAEHFVLGVIDAYLYAQTMPTLVFLIHTLHCKIYQ